MIQLVPLVAALGAEVGEHVVVDGDVAAKPLIWQRLFTEACEFTRAALAFQGGEHPERDQQTKIGAVANDMMHDRLDVGEPGVKVELTDEAPGDANRRIGIELFAEGGPAHLDLIAVADAEPWPSSPGFLGGFGRAWAREDRRET
jgi:hypothetical protein